MPKKKAVHVNVSMILLRVALGWFFFYSGLNKVMTPDWSAAGFLGGAETFQGLYSWFGAEANIGWVSFLNKWGQLAIGLGLVTGTLVRLASYSGALMMLLYYFPSLNFPYSGEHGFLVDDHIIYALAFLLLAQLSAGKQLGIDYLLEKKLRWKERWWF